MPYGRGLISLKLFRNTKPSLRICLVENEKHTSLIRHNRVSSIAISGSMWSQNWELYHNLILPFSEVDLEANLKKQNWTKIDMVKRAEDFYVSLGLPAMTKSFWRNSNFERNSHVSKCHGSAANMFNGSDYRLNFFVLYLSTDGK